MKSHSRNTNVIFLVAVMLAALCSSGSAVLLYDNGTFDPSGGATSDFGSVGQAGDNFSLATPGVAQQIEWWGFYNNPPPAQDDFTVRFFSFTGFNPNVNPFSDLQVGNNLTRTDTGSTSPGGSIIYRYSATIADTSLAAGTPYLLSIVNNTVADWIWSKSVLPGTSWIRFSEGSGWGTAPFGGLAFNISETNPTPSVPDANPSALLLAIGAIALLAFRRTLSSNPH